MSEIAPSVGLVFLTGESAAFNNEPLECPYCPEKYNEVPYVHFDAPKHIVTDGGIAWQGRGSAILIPMWCESGHKWTLGLGFHKGQSWLFLR